MMLLTKNGTWRWGIERLKCRFNIHMMMLYAIIVHTKKNKIQINKCAKSKHKHFLSETNTKKKTSPDSLTMSSSTKMTVIDCSSFLCVLYMCLQGTGSIKLKEGKQCFVHKFTNQLWSVWAALSTFSRHVNLLNRSP